MTIDVEVTDGIATITIDSPKTRNALNPESSRRLVQVCDQVDADPAVGAVIVRGGGGTFCSGAEREVLARAGEDPADPERFAELGSIYDAFVRVGNMSVPTIAAVQGAAVGAGVNLLLATDLRIVAHDTRIIAGFTRIGLHPGGGHFTLLGRVVSREAAAAIGLFGAEVSGTRAAELGLAWESVDAADVDARARELAAAAARDPELSRRVLGSMRRELDPPGVSWPVALELERGSQMWSLRRRNS
ncbi:MAG: enoyl-CoA hydratase/isomerase family protein [Actinophytocola sp.]|uniref:enoyl-CoA hydratase-related protein n=1 Tax=Actinophytocola sp. TaxID=1872138 RepID=UPI00132C6D20|nr:enoyl-CoA hydratase-related protein [Actinophytocola sp.]MPZ79571.1 enoyl-CoA hydratase/isomerase family protein [Actinophytocola sp.]